MNIHYDFFRENFPYIVRNNQEVLKIITNPENKFFDVLDEKNHLTATSIIHKNTILLLCVKENQRNKGIGSQLLLKSEKFIKEKGYDCVNIGAGDNYLMPGIPVRTQPYKEKLNLGEIYSQVSDNAYNFFLKRGYEHSWKDANCFDMRADLEKTEFQSESIGDTINGIKYRFAKKEDLPAIIKCTDDAEKDFSIFYQNPLLYEENSFCKVLIAVKTDEVCGTLIVGAEEEAVGLGSVGCTTVCHKYQKQHIAVNMVILGTKYLKSLGLKNGYLGYTYSGLDKMYGYAGYKICIFYAMGKKNL